MIIVVDTETTGMDAHHGSDVYLVSITVDGEYTWMYRWEVDPLTRKVKPNSENVREIIEFLDQAEVIVFHNAGFDVKMLNVRFRAEGFEYDWPWEKIEDTILGAHLLWSSERKSLDYLALMKLRKNIEKYEKAVGDATKEARRIAKSKYPRWKIASKSLVKEMPSAYNSQKLWKADMWLTELIAKVEKYPPEHPWHTCLTDYASGDTETTYLLWEKINEEVDRRDLRRIYEVRHKILPLIDDMEEYGVTVDLDRLAEQKAEYAEESERLGRKMVRIAAIYGSDLVLPKTGNNKSLTETLFKDMGVPAIAVSEKTGAPSLNKAVVGKYLEELPKTSKQYHFIKALADKRKRDTALNYMEGYARFGRRFLRRSYMRLHPNLNPTGTNTLRWSSSNPNEQNISKTEGFNLRYSFGPAPGREWWSLDANNIELRIPAFEAGETEMVELFLRPNDPPFYGSNHLLVFSVIWPELWAEYGTDVKKKFASTYYQWTKNGNFAVQYGAINKTGENEMGTADRAYHQKGAQSKVEARFKNITKLNRTMIAKAEEFGYVETIPDKTVDPDRGYPLQCPKTDYGRVSPTVPLNYHVQGTAMWWMMKAMIRVSEFLKDLPGYYMIMQVHDELVFDFPYKADMGNLPVVKEIQRLMEMGGDDIGIPTPVGIDYHPKNWSESVSVE